MFKLFGRVITGTSPRVTTVGTRNQQGVSNPLSKAISSIILTAIRALICTSFRTYVGLGWRARSGCFQCPTRYITLSSRWSGILFFTNPSSVSTGPNLNSCLNFVEESTPVAGPLLIKGFGSWFEHDAEEESRDRRRNDTRCDLHPDGMYT